MGVNRKKRFDYGHWQTQRDRFGFLPDEPPPVFDVQPISNLISTIVSDIKPEPEDSWIFELTREWKELVGSTYAAHTRPGKIHERKLYIYVKHSIWLTEFLRNGKHPTLVRLQKRFGAKRVQSISVQLDPDG